MSGGERIVGRGSVFMCISRLVCCPMHTRRCLNLAAGKTLSAGAWGKKCTIAMPCLLPRNPTQTQGEGGTSSYCVGIGSADDDVCTQRRRSPETDTEALQEAHRLHRRHRRRTRDVAMRLQGSRYAAPARGSKG